MLKVRILYGKPFESSWQEKSFKDETAAMEWCRRNAEKICCINDYRTMCLPVSQYEIMDALRGVSR